MPAECHTVPLYALLPHGVCPLSAPRCFTDYGVCRYPEVLPMQRKPGFIPAPGGGDYFQVKGGMQCQCQAPNGAWATGIIR